MCPYCRGDHPIYIQVTGYSGSTVLYTSPLRVSGKAVGRLPAGEGVVLASVVQNTQQGVSWQEEPVVYSQSIATETLHGKNLHQMHALCALSRAMINCDDCKESWLRPCYTQHTHTHTHAHTHNNITLNSRGSLSKSLVVSGNKNSALLCVSGSMHSLESATCEQWPQS